MESAETSSLAGLRARGSAIDPGAVTVVLLLLGAAIFLLIGCLKSTNFAQYTIQGLALGSVYGSLALALVLVYRATHVINFAQGELAMLTTYIAYALGLHGLSYWEAFAATLAIAFVIGTVLQITVIRPVQHRSVIAVVIVTVGLFILIDGVVNWIWGGDFKSMKTPFGNGSFEIGGVAIQHLYVGMLAVVRGSVVVVWAVLRYS
jgi:branched-chain amino acid transport system permease protein